MAGTSRAGRFAIRAGGFTESELGSPMSQLCEERLNRLVALWLPCQQPDHASDNKQRKRTSNTQDSEHRHGIPARRRVVAAAVKQDQIGRITDPMPGSIKDSQPQVP